MTLSRPQIRLVQLIVALTVACAMSVTLASRASADPFPTDDPKPTVVAQTSTPYVEANGNASISAQLARPGTQSNAGQTLTLWGNDYGAGSWAWIQRGEATTAADGTANFTAPIGTVSVTFKVGYTQSGTDYYSNNVAVTATEAAKPTVTAETSTPYVEANGNASISAQLARPGTQSNAGQTLTLWGNDYGAGSWAWTQRGEATTAADGTANFTAPIGTVSVTFKVGYTQSGTDYYSNNVAVDIRAVTFLQMSQRFPRVDGATPELSAELKAICCHSTVTAATVPDETIELWFLAGDGDGSWHKVQEATSSSSGIVDFGRAPQRTGTYQARFSGSDPYLATSSQNQYVRRYEQLNIELDDPQSVPERLTGTVSDSNGPRAGAPIYLSYCGSGRCDEQKRREIGPVYNWSDSARTTTSEDGTFSFDVRGHSYAYVAVRYPWSYYPPIGLRQVDEYYPSFAPADRTALWLPGYALTAKFTSERVAQGDRNELEVHLSPGRPNVNVTLTATVKGSESTVTTGNTDSSGSTVLRVPALIPADSYALTATAAGVYERINLSPFQIYRTTTASITAPAQVSAGATTVLKGSLSSSGDNQGLPAQTVTVQVATGQGVNGNATPQTWTPISTTVTDDSGNFSLPVTVAANSRYQVVYAGALLNGIYLTPTTATSGYVRAIRATKFATLQVSPTKIGSKSPVRVTSTLTWSTPTKALVSVPVELWQSTAGATWVKIATTATDRTGKTTWTLKPVYTTRYQARHTGSSNLDGYTTTASNSTASRVDVAARVTLLGPAKAKAGKAATFSGSVTPAKSSQRVTLAIGRKTVGSANTDAYGRYKITIKLARGTVILNATASTTSYYLTATSPFLPVKVS